MRRTRLRRWETLLTCMLLVLALGVGVLSSPPGLQAFAEVPLPEAAKQKLAKQILTLSGGEARGFVRVTIEETGPAEWPQMHYVRLWLEHSNGLRRPMLVYVSPDGAHLFFGTLIETDTLANLTQARQRDVLPRYDVGRIDFAQVHMRGTPGAPLRLIEFSDFQCPFCARLQPVLDRLLQDYSGKVVHYFKHAPLARIHPLAERLHEAAECASRQREEAFWDFHRRAFTTKTTDWDVATIRKTTEAWARELGLDSAALLTCFDTRSTAVVVTKNLAEFPVSATPTLLVGDEVVQGALPYEQLKATVERKLHAMGALPQDLPLRTLDRGTYSGVRERLAAVIKTEEAWYALWQRHVAGVEPRRGLPPVDFSREMVAAVFMGEQPTSGGTAEVVGATQEGGSLVVRIRQVPAPAGGVGLSVLTQPFHLVLIPRSELPVKFEWAEAK